ncbi:hypothetical protein [Bradyrhizobium sp. CCGUVB14]|uniref:hypothetical protein n=1 Tax=Bradyrhizobium sp. CCGUVB14 TaxID=2949628 RepID=UPI0020B25EA3|nr:hypothetical protein [Bradyrhizobium sp. CCGUVB14]MCP3441311.1 hypothetical protein [Bradyrhizobium sp. CCGUVB14]
MDLNDSNRFDPGHWQADDAMLQQQEEGRSRSENFEQHLHEARRADSLVSREVTPQDRYFPCLSDKDHRLIQDAAPDFARQGLRPRTAANYARALRRLGNHLGGQGQTIDGIDHSSLVAHAERAFPRDAEMVCALNALQAHRDPSAPSGKRRRTELSVEDTRLIDEVGQAEIAHGKLTAETYQRYAAALRKLGKRLEEQGQTIAGADDNFLITYAKKFFPRDADMRTALNALRRYRDANASVDNCPRIQVSVEDADLIDGAMRAAAAQRSWKPNTVVVYVRALRKLANLLGPHQTITTIDDNSLLAHANKSFPNSWTMKTALEAFRAYRNCEPLADAGSQGPRASRKGGPVLGDVTLPQTTLTAELTMTGDYRNSLEQAVSWPGDSRPTGGQVPHSLAQPDDPEEIWQGSEQAIQLPTESWGSADFWQGMPSPSNLLGPTVREPEPTVPSQVQADDPDELWRGPEQAIQLPTDSWGPMDFWQGMPSPSNIPGLTVREPEPTVPSQVQAVDPEELWPGPEQAIQLPTDSWGSPDFWQGMPSPSNLPELTVRESEPTVSSQVQAVDPQKI